jgi:hypothetical protein
LVASHIPITLRRSAGRPSSLAMSPAPTANGSSVMATSAGSRHLPRTARVRLAHVVRDIARRGRRGTTRPFTSMGSRAQETRATSRLPLFETSLRDTRALGRRRGARKTCRQTFTRSWPKPSSPSRCQSIRIEGNFKLGQNRSQDDRLGMLQGLDAEKSSRRRTR